MQTRSPAAASSRAITAPPAPEPTTQASTRSSIVPETSVRISAAEGTWLFDAARWGAVQQSLLGALGQLHLRDPDSVGVDAGRLFVGFMIALRRKLNGLWFLVSQLYLQAVARRGDGDVAVSQPTHQVEGLARRLLESEPQG